MKNIFGVIFYVFVGMILVSCGTKGKSVDHSDPVKVVEAIFEAARKQDASVLPTLCNAKVDRDKDVQYVCEAHPKNKVWKPFLKWFPKGRVSGKAEIKGDHAKVPFVFGPAGKRKEVMNLKKYNGKWYLSRF